MSRSSIFPVLTLSLVLGAASTARADLVPPNSTQCTDLEAGDPCLDDLQKPGTCVKSTCTKLDYSHGSPPVLIKVPCLLCKANATSPIATKDQEAADVAGSKATIGGCAMTQAPTGAAWLTALLALPLLRRRRRAH